MRTRANVVGLAGLAAMTAWAGSAGALNKRIEVAQPGDFVMIGNTLGQDCSLQTPDPVVGTLDCTNAGFTSDFSPDVFWMSDGATATANSMVMVDQASSTAVLEVPPTAVITHAYLYWAARNSTGSGDLKVNLMRSGAEPVEVKAPFSFPGNSNVYSGTADVTAYVQQNGPGAYTVSGVESVYLASASPEPDAFAVWWMAVLYQDDTLPYRLLTIHDGLESISNGVDSTVKVTNFVVPNNFSEAKVGVVGYDGDKILQGDQFLVGDALLDDGTNDPLKNNFFNGTRTFLGVPVSVAGDLPQLSGEPGSMNRLDMDVVAITPHLLPGQTEVTFTATSIGEAPYVEAVITSIPTFADKDGDGLDDDEEKLFGTDPADADTDDDGLADGKEGCADAAACEKPVWNEDTDGDGLINALDIDADNDGLFDGTETGSNCAGPGTLKAAGYCVPDADQGATVTNPISADSDGGGARDGSEDANLNGAIDAGETDPATGHEGDDASVMDTDGDGMSDSLEFTLHALPMDADTDNDGVLDGAEANPSADTDGDGLLNVNDEDSDNDALFDGTELGLDCENAATDKAAKLCIADADLGVTRTSMLLADSDGGGIKDGSEDVNRDGVVGENETDPTLGHADDDGTVVDSDGDGLSDELEVLLGSNPMDTDSDDDGAPDGAEAGPSVDSDGDGKLNILDEDSDNDGLFDGLEGGFACDDPINTNMDAGHCVADADSGKTKTSPLKADTDGGGVPDGIEDFNLNGSFEPGEGDPNDATDDPDVHPCSADADCGAANSGVVCDIPTKACVPGCRGAEGSGCPEGQVCSSADQTIGSCDTPSTGPGGDTGGTSGGGGVASGGCACGVRPSSTSPELAWAFAIAVGGCAALRRRRRAG